MKIRLLFSALLAILFFHASAQVTTVGLIGSATPGGWDTDTDMIQDATDTSVWTINVDLVNGEVKFRANDDWAQNWGSADFPVGVGIQDGPNIPVFGGNYDVTFNHTTGDYTFILNSAIGIIGDATPGGWDEDTNMYTAEDGTFFITIDLEVGAAKFRADDDWAVNWGSADFPMGIGTQDGANIEVGAAGTYFITLDTASGAYSFDDQVSYETVGIIGDATPGGWDMDTDMERSADDPNQWSLFIELTDGEVKFRAEDDWIINWGSTEFPMGTAVSGGDNIPVTAGFYKIDFNSDSGEYSFAEVGNYTTVGIIGDATPGGWDTDTDLTQDPDDPTIWTTSLELTDGEVKFRAEDDWGVNWGGPGFPMGIATQGGANIPVVAGEYNITFNSLSGEYNFEVFVVYDQISLVGEAGPFGAWPAEDDMGAVDTYLDRDADNDQLWSVAGVLLSDAADGGGVKFRANTDWAVNWGMDTFPFGVGTQDGPNILCVAGLYDVTFNSLTGEFMFADPNSTTEVLDPATIAIYPNPAADLISVDLSAINLSNSGVISIFDTNGRLVTRLNQKISEVINVDVSQLRNGQYLMHISDGSNVIGKRFMVLK